MSSNSLLQVFHSTLPFPQLSQSRPPETRPLLPAIQREPGKEVGPEKEAEPGKKEAPPTGEEVQAAEKEQEDSSSSGSGSSSSVHSEQEQAS